MQTNETELNSRYQAFRVLKLVLVNGQTLSQALNDVDQVTAFGKALSFGVLRDFQRIDIILTHLMAKKPKKMAVRIILSLGIFQLLNTHKPDYAVVSEMVRVSRKVKLVWASGVINGVLRQFIRQREAVMRDCASDNDYQNNHPQWLVSALTKAWPDDVASLLKENDRQAPMSLRVNLSRLTREAYGQLLTDHAIAYSTSTCIDSSMTLTEAMPVHQLPGFEQGLVSVQDTAAQMAAFLLQLSEHQRILDACCAPGGKTGHILESQKQLDLVAIDSSTSRLEKVRDNLKRLGVSAQLICADAGDTDQWWDGQPFDRILLDAPCSATGIIRRQPDIKYHRKPEQIEALVLTQCRLLNSLWGVLKPGGLLVYATCSVLPEENEAQILQFLQENTDAELVPTDLPIQSATDIGLQLFPQKDGYDGFYYAKLRKSAGTMEVI